CLVGSYFIATPRSLVGNRFPEARSLMPCLRTPLYPGPGQLRVDLRDQPRQACFVVRFGAGDEHVLGVGGAQQPPAVGRGDARAIGAVDLGAMRFDAVEHFLDGLALWGPVRLG